MDQVVEIDVDGKVLAHADGNRPDERKVVKNDLVPERGGGLCGLEVVGAFCVSGLKQSQLPYIS